MSILNFIMFVVVYYLLKGLTAFSAVDGKMHALLYILICAFVGGVIYAYLSLKTGLAQKLFGERLTRFTKKLGF